MPTAPPFHVWVDVTGRWGSSADPGILVAWRRGRRGGWEALVVTGSARALAHGGDVDLRWHWVDAGMVRPAVTSPPPVNSGRAG
jgi:hypothetical protein